MPSDMKRDTYLYMENIEYTATCPATVLQDIKLCSWPYEKADCS